MNAQKISFKKTSKKICYKKYDLAESIVDQGFYVKEEKDMAFILVENSLNQLKIQDSDGQATEKDKKKKKKKQKKNNGVIGETILTSQI